MNLFESINQTRFLGKEFLTWLCIQLKVRGYFWPVKKSVTLWFDDRIVLELAFENVKEVNTIRGENPTGTEEAKAALRMGRRSAPPNLE